MDNKPLDVLGGIVDRLAAVKADIASLKAEEAQLKQLLIDSDESVIEGTEHRAALSWMVGRPVIDWRAIAEHFNPSRQLVRANTTVGDDFVVVRVSARKSA